LEQKLKHFEETFEQQDEKIESLTKKLNLEDDQEVQQLREKIRNDEKQFEQLEKQK